jgi:hypothetical protein
MVAVVNIGDVISSYFGGGMVVLGGLSETNDF